MLFINLDAVWTSAILTNLKSVHDSSRQCRREHCQLRTSGHKSLLDLNGRIWMCARAASQLRVVCVISDGLQVHLYCCRPHNRASSYGSSPLPSFWNYFCDLIRAEHVVSYYTLVSLKAILLSFHQRGSDKLTWGMAQSPPVEVPIFCLRI